MTISSHSSCLQFWLWTEHCNSSVSHEMLEASRCYMRYAHNSLYTHIYKHRHTAAYHLMNRLQDEKKVCSVREWNGEKTNNGQWKKFCWWRTNHLFECQRRTLAQRDRRRERKPFRVDKTEDMKTQSLNTNKNAIDSFFSVDGDSQMVRKNRKWNLAIKQQLKHHDKTKKNIHSQQSESVRC